MRQLVTLDLFIFPYVLVSYRSVYFYSFFPDNATEARMHGTSARGFTVTRRAGGLQDKGPEATQIDYEIQCLHTDRKGKSSD